MWLWVYPGSDSAGASTQGWSSRAVHAVCAPCWLQVQSQYARSSPAHCWHCKPLSGATACWTWAAPAMYTARSTGYWHKTCYMQHLAALTPCTGFGIAQHRHGMQNARCASPPGHMQHLQCQIQPGCQTCCMQRTALIRDLWVRSYGSMV